MKSGRYRIASGMRDYYADTLASAKEIASECAFAHVFDTKLGKEVKIRRCEMCGATGLLNDSKKMPLCDDCDEEMRVELANFKRYELGGVR